MPIVATHIENLLNHDWYWDCCVSVVSLNLSDKFNGQDAIMLIRGWRFITLVLAALALTMESAHLLELPQKMQYGAQMYSAVNGTLYKYFAIVGGTYQIGSILASGSLSFLVRRRTALVWTLVGFVFLLLAFGLWLAVVAPVNSEIADALRSAPESVPTLWLRLRGRWESGHVVGFVLQLIGFCALVFSVLIETPKDDAREIARDHPRSKGKSTRRIARATAIISR